MCKTKHPHFLTTLHGKFQLPLLKRFQNQQTNQGSGKTTRENKRHYDDMKAWKFWRLSDRPNPVPLAVTSTKCIMLCLTSNNLKSPISCLRRLEGIGKMDKALFVCLCNSVCVTGRFNLSLITVQYMNTVSRGDSSVLGSCSAQCFLCAFCGLTLVGLSQKVYPIITVNYHYHFLCVCVPSNLANCIC